MLWGERVWPAMVAAVIATLRAAAEAVVQRPRARAEWGCGGCGDGVEVGVGWGC